MTQYWSLLLKNCVHSYIALAPLTLQVGSHASGPANYLALYLLRRVHSNYFIVSTVSQLLMQYKLTVFMLPSLSLIYGIDLLLGACAYCSDCMYIYNYKCLIKDMYLTNSIFIPIIMTILICYLHYTCWRSTSLAIYSDWNTRGEWKKARLGKQCCKTMNVLWAERSASQPSRERAHEEDPKGTLCIPYVTYYHSWLVQMYTLNM